MGRDYVDIIHGTGFNLNKATQDFYTKDDLEKEKMLKEIVEYARNNIISDEEKEFAITIATYFRLINISNNDLKKDCKNYFKIGLTYVFKVGDDLFCCKMIVGIPKMDEVTITSAVGNVLLDMNSGDTEEIDLNGEKTKIELIAVVSNKEEAEITKRIYQMIHNYLSAFSDSSIPNLDEEEKICSEIRSLRKISRPDPLVSNPLKRIRVGECFVMLGKDGVYFSRLVLAQPKSNVDSIATKIDVFSDLGKVLSGMNVGEKISLMVEDKKTRVKTREKLELIASSDSTSKAIDSAITYLVGKWRTGMKGNEKAAVKKLTGYLHLMSSNSTYVDSGYWAIVMNNRANNSNDIQVLQVSPYPYKHGKGKGNGFISLASFGGEQILAGNYSLVDIVHSKEEAEDTAKLALLIQNVYRMGKGYVLDKAQDLRDKGYSGKYTKIGLFFALEKEDGKIIERQLVAGNANDDEISIKSTLGQKILDTPTHDRAIESGCIIEYTIGNRSSRYKVIATAETFDGLRRKMSYKKGKIKSLGSWPESKPKN